MISTRRLLQLIAEKDAAFAQERLNWTIERADLCNRIKPEAAQGIYRPDFSPTQPVDMFDDSSYTTDPSDLEKLMQRAIDEGVTTPDDFDGPIS